jgi:hypothetical protein
MTQLVPVSMAVWPALVLVLFAAWRPRRAVIAGFLIGWMFLPVVSYPIQGLPDLDKMLATCLGVFVAAVAFDRRRFVTFRPGWVDLPVAILCAAPFASSVRNGLGVYDGLSAAFEQTVTWGLPYLLGRVYLGTPDGLRELATGALAGGLAYVPLCWFEILRGPELHRMLYGYHQHVLEQAIRFGGWRPMVFMDHGLMVALWMASSSVIGIWLWRTGAVRRMWRVPLAWLVTALVTTMLFLKSVNAWVLLPLGIAMLFSSARLRRPVLVGVVIALVILYVTVRAAGLWDAETMAQVASGLFGESKGQSLAYRVQNEELLAERAREQPLLGWGRWGRNLLRDENGNSPTVAESLWIITFGQVGLIGLAALMALLLLPQASFVRRYAAGLWASPQLAPAAAWMTVLTLYAVDSLLNAMVNPVYMLAAGGLVGLGGRRHQALPGGPGWGDAGGAPC